VGRCREGTGAEATIAEATTEGAIRIEWVRSDRTYRPREALTGHLVVDPAEIDALGKGSTLGVTGRVIDWKKLSLLPVLEP
jgi:hypothetical protein